MRLKNSIVRNKIVSNIEKDFTMQEEIEKQISEKCDELEKLELIISNEAEGDMEASTKQLEEFEANENNEVEK